MREQPELGAVAEEDDPEGPWGVYDVYCLKCGHRALSVAPVSAEAVELWECSKDCGFTMTHHLREDDDE